jgi:toxin CptA
MELSIASVGIVVALLAAGTMGFAIQRGATCTVAAMDEIVSKRSGKRLWAMLEAALWVAVGLGLAQRMHWLGALPKGYALSQWTFVGAVLLGFGAWVNKACVFGAIARLGSGEWAYAVTPVGYYLGCLSVQAVFLTTAPPSHSSEMFMHVAASGALLPLLILMGWRFYAMFWRKGRADLGPVMARARAAVWSPHGATIVIGFMFLSTIILVGNWAYTDVLAELAQGMSKTLRAGVLMAAALLVGAMVGGYTAGRMRWHALSVTAVTRCFVGGVLMAWGSLLIPGGNDGLILVGMPLLWPYAWAAFLTMCLTVGLAQATQARIAGRAAG